MSRTYKLRNKQHKRANQYRSPSFSPHNARCCKCGRQYAIHHGREADFPCGCGGKIKLK